MHDLKAIRENPDGFRLMLDRRGHSYSVDAILSADQNMRGASSLLQESQSRRNAIAKHIATAMKEGDLEMVTALKAEGEQLKTTIPKLEQEVSEKNNLLTYLMAQVPNLLAGDVPAGTSEDENVEIHTSGANQVFDFEPKEHFDLKVGLDFEAGARLSGSRFTVLRSQAAKLHRALGQFMLDELTKQGYEEIIPPLLVKEEALFGTGQLPKFEDDLFRTTDNRWLIPTAEVSLTNIVRDQILTESELPMRLTALTQCFRAEAGSAGRDTRGLIRQHQFEKVEMVSIVTPDQSSLELERMTNAAEHILERLGLRFRRMLLCAGDVGFSAAKTYDLEVWLPGQKRFREISSCSTCTDFQARRMNTRFRPADEKSTKFVHTLNGSGVAVGRALVAVLENYQQADGSVATPEVLMPYLPST